MPFPFQGVMCVTRHQAFGKVWRRMQAGKARSSHNSQDLTGLRYAHSLEKNETFLTQIHVESLQKERA